MSDTTVVNTAWAEAGLVIGAEYPRLLLCSTLDGVAYFADDAPVPSVGQDDEEQPIYGIHEQREDGSLNLLGAFYDQQDYRTFIALLDKAVSYMLKQSTHLATVRLMEALTPKEE